MKLLTISDIRQLVLEYDFLEEWQKVKEYALTYYDNNAAIVIVKTANQYNDEYYVEKISSVKVYDQNNQELLPNFSLQAWQYFLKKQNNITPAEYQKQYSLKVAEENDDDDIPWDVYDYLADIWKKTLSALQNVPQDEQAEIRYTLLQQPSITYPEVYTIDNK